MKSSPSIAAFILSFLLFMGVSDSVWAASGTSETSRTSEPTEESDAQDVPTSELDCGIAPRGKPPIRRQARQRKSRSFGLYAASILFSCGILSSWSVRPPTKSDEPDWTTSPQPNRLIFLSAQSLRAPPVYCA